jgi:sialidase-1
MKTRLATLLLVLIHWQCNCPQAGIAADASEQVRQVCLEVLREGVRSDEFWPSIHAAEALTLAGHADEVRELLAPKLIAETDDQKKCGLARELVRAGDRSKASVMLEIIAGDDPYGHVHAAESLYKVREIGDGVAIRGAMAQTANAKLRLMAAGALARCGNPAAMDLLRESIRDKDPELRKITAWLLARLGDDSDIPALRDALKRADTDPVRCYFENALATLGDNEGLKALARSLNHEDPAVRVYAATFAGDARATSVGPDLIKLLDDPTLDVRIRAAQSILVLSQPEPADAYE